jgi:serine/threonine protein kinase
MGTVRWSAPECLDPEKFGFGRNSRKRLPSKSTDIYALGMTIYEASEHIYRVNVLEVHGLADRL